MPNPPKRLQTFLVVAVGVFMSTLDSSMVNIALPSIMGEFHSSLATTKWVVMIYLLTVTVTLLFWGHLADRFGRERIYPTGMLIFGVGSFFCGIAGQISWLIFWRFCQAIGAAMMMSTGPAIIKETFPPEKLGRSLGLIGVAVSAGLMTGPALGGILVEYYSWRSIFLVTVPIGLLFSLLAAATLPKTLRSDLRYIDFPGSAAWAASICLLVFALSAENLAFLLPLAGSIIFFYIFIRHEAKSPAPVLPLALFKERFFCIGVASALISFTVLFSVIILMPFYLDRILGLSPSRIGLIMMAIPISVLVVAPPAGWLYDYIGAKYLTTVGLLLSTGSLLLLTGLGPETRPLAVAAKLAMLGCGQAMFLSPNSASVLARVKDELAGVSAGLLATARNLGMLLGVAQAGLIFSYFFSLQTNGLDLKDFTAGQTPAFLNALAISFYTAAAIGLGGVVFSWLRGSGKQQRTAKTAPGKSRLDG